jgi:acetyl-CoA carboxylase carboxyltransferase component
MDKKPTNPDELGALWIKTSAKTGVVFLTGTISGVEVVIFRNDKKVEGSNQPDWRVLKSKPRDNTPLKTDNPFAAGTPDEDAPF